MKTRNTRQGRRAPASVDLRLPPIPDDVMPADPRDYYAGTWLSPVWALFFGPLYYMLHGFWRECVLVALLTPFGVGLLISPILARGAWERRAIDRADKANLETLITLLVRRNI